MAPRWLGWTHPRYGTPVGGLLLVAAGTALILAASFTGVLTVRSLIALPTANFIMTYVLGCAAGVWLARNRTERVLAVVALAASVAVAPFLGWALLYPFAIGVAVTLRRLPLDLRRDAALEYEREA
jgi:amino acid efflux transporter